LKITAKARAEGFTVQSVPEGTRIERKRDRLCCKAWRRCFPRFTVRAGVMMCGEIGTLVECGFQNFQTPAVNVKPALAEE